MSNKTFGGVTRDAASNGQKAFGSRGGNGTSQPHLAIAPMIPVKIPIQIYKPTCRRAGAVIKSKPTFILQNSFQFLILGDYNK